MALDKCRGWRLSATPIFTAAWTAPPPGAILSSSASICARNRTRSGRLVGSGHGHFQEVYDYFDGLAESREPALGPLDGPPLLLARCISRAVISRALISPAMFDAFGLPVLREEVRPMTHNIFHVDGRGVLKDLEMDPSVPEIQAIQLGPGHGS